MKERPILFRGAMVRALLAGSKTQTRRVIAPRPSGEKPVEIWWKGGKSWDGHQFENVTPPWGEVDRRTHAVVFPRLWVRETLTRRDSTRPDRNNVWEYAADGREVGFHDLDDLASVQVRWSSHSRRTTCSSIHMPRWASRISLQLTDVRAQRLQDITEADAIAEGATRRGAGWSMDWSRVGEPAFDKKPLREDDISLGTARHAFGNYFAKINGKHAWEENPWVWALTFRRVAVSDDARYRLWFQLLRAEFATRGDAWAAYGQHISMDGAAWRQSFDDGLSAEEACDAEIDAAQGN